MKIINGPKWLNLASSTRSIKLAPLTISDNMIADRQLLATLMTTYKPGEFLIFMDSSLELSTFTSLDLGTKTGLKSRFLCTDIEYGISKMITPYEEAAAKEAEEAKKAQLEADEMASYKQKYEDAKSQLDATFEENNNLRKAYNDEMTKVTEMATKLSESESTIMELRTALQSAADKIESMKTEFNGVCREFGLSKNTISDGRFKDSTWNQDLDNQLVPLSGSLRRLADSVTNIELPEGSCHWECKISGLVDTILDNEKVREDTFRSLQENYEHLQIEFNSACKEFGLSKNAEGKWSQDPNVLPKYVELLNQYQDKVTELSSTKSELVAKSRDYDQLVIEFENYKKSWTLVHDDLMEVQKQFGIYKDDNGKWCRIQDDKYEGDSNTTAPEVDEVDNAVTTNNAPKEITK